VKNTNQVLKSDKPS